jgi:hypothetical protein
MSALATSALVVLVFAMTTIHSRTLRPTLHGILVTVAAVVFARPAVGQPLPPASASVSDRAAGSDNYSPITPQQRLDWSADGVFGRSAVLAAIAGDVWLTGWNTPPEWGRTWRGAGLRLAQREADVALSSGIEAGLGALWSEDPRYLRLGHGAIARRFGYAVRTVFLAPRKHGEMAPAWARYAGNTMNNVIENAWLPPSQRTWQATVIRSGNGIFGRLATNLWGEFGPDMRRHLLNRPAAEIIHRRSAPGSSLRD